MNKHEGRYVHPEVRLEVIKEFSRLRIKHPSLDGDALWAMSRDYCWTVALADSAIMRLEMLIP